MKNKIQSLILFLYIWLCIGFPMGLWVLLAGPSKWLSEYAQSTGMEISEENLIGKLIIILYVIVAFILALIIYRFVERSSKKIIKWLVPGFLTIILFTSVYIFSFHPQWLISYSGDIPLKGVEITQDNNSSQLEFVFGSYPNEQMIKSLKEQGYDGIISLLHELVIPAEPNLLKDEIKNAEKYGIKVINMPMLPWISGNEKTLEKAKEFIKNETGLYYVHCYLGRDRVNAFKAAIKNSQISIKIDPISLEELFKNKKKFERGDYYKIEDEIYLTPYPTDMEFMRYVLSDNFKTVISLLDNNNVENIPLIEKENQLFIDFPLNYIHYPVADSFNQADLDKLKILINKNEKPILIHRFFTNDPVSKFIIDNY